MHIIGIGSPILFGMRHGGKSEIGWSAVGAAGGPHRGGLVSMAPDLHVLSYPIQLLLLLFFLCHTICYYVWIDSTFWCFLRNSLVFGHNVFFARRPSLIPKYNSGHAPPATVIDWIPRITSLSVGWKKSSAPEFLFPPVIINPPRKQKQNQI